MAVSDDNGNLIEHYRYTAFGEPEIYGPTGTKLTETAIDNDILWNVRRYEPATNLYLYKYRDYDAITGRWPSRDPIKEKGGVNLYGLANNNVVADFDILGLVTEWSDCGPTNKKKFNVSYILLTQATTSGKLPDDIIDDFTDLYNSISNWSTFASWAQISQGVANAGLSGVSDGAAADIVTGFLSRNNPADVKDAVIEKLDSLSKILEENALYGAMITIKFRCRTCVCDKKTKVWGWDWPEEQSLPYVVDDQWSNEGEVVRLLSESEDGIRVKVSAIQPWHIKDAVELARKSCEGE
jgi:RHS repeat-associated protein